MNDKTGTFDATPGVGGSGTISNVPVGERRRIVVEGLQADKTTVDYMGVASGITIAQGQASAVPVAMLADDFVDPNPAAWFLGGPGDGEVSLFWGKPTSGEYAGVQIRSSTSGTPASVLDGALVYDGVGTSFVDSGLTNDEQQYYALFVYDDWLHYSTGTPLNVIPAGTISAPNAPGTLSATPDDGAVDLTWSAPSGGAAQTVYNVYRALADPVSTSGTPLATVPGNQTSYSDTSVTNETEYFYAVTAVNAGGAGPASNQASTTPKALPGAPASFGGQPGNAFVELSWSAPASGGSITGYELYRDTSSGVSTTGTPLAALAANIVTYTDSAVVNDTAYYYKLLAVNAVGKGPASSEVQVTPIAVPNPPESVQAVAANAQVTVSWNAPSVGPTPTGYDVFRSTTSTVNTGGTAIGGTSAPTTQFVDSAVSNGTSYWYAVVAVNAVGSGIASATVGPATPDIAPAAAPTSLGATAGDCVVNLSWTAPVGGGAPTSYSVYRGTSAGVSTGGAAYATTGSAATSYQDSSVNGSGTTYYYKVVATNAGGSSPASNEANASVNCSPNAPQSLTATAGDSVVNLSWSAPSGGEAHTGYSVFRSTSSPVSTGGSALATVSSGTTTYQDTAVVNLTTYYYVVVATNATGASPPSNEPSATPADVTAPAQAKLFTATVRDGQVDLEWIEPPDGDYAGVKICGSTSAYPTDPTSCTAVFNNTGTTVAHVTANGTQWYYTAFTYDEVPNYSAGAKASATPGSWIKAGASNSSSYVLRADGTVWGWGNNSWGQLGDGTTTSRLDPVQVCAANGTPPCATFLTGVDDISFGQFHNLALAGDGTVWGWGYNAQGTLGDGTTTARSKPVKVCWAHDGSSCLLELNNVVGIAASYQYSMALRGDGTVWAWGANNSGQLGNGTTANSLLPVQVCTTHNGTNCTAYLTGVVAIASRAATSYAVKSDGTVWAWGIGGAGQIGDGSNSGVLLPQQVCVTFVVDTCTEYLTGIARIAAGWEFALALGEDGSLWAWGGNLYGQLGNNSVGNKNTAQLVDSSGAWARIAPGDYHTVALKNDGTLWSWGRNFTGELGDGTNVASRKAPVQVSGAASDWNFASGGTNHSVAISGDGTVHSWGFNASGELGLGVTSRKLLPVVVGSFGDWIQLAGGSYHTLAVRIGGTLWGWGLNASGQLGDGTVAQGPRKSPGQIGSDIDWSKTAGGSAFSLALKSNGTVWSWGQGSQGELGSGAFTSRLTPGQVCAPGGCGTSLSNISAIAAGILNGMVLDSTDGSVWMFGNNQFGQLGNGAAPGQNTKSSLPVQVCADWDSVGLTCNAFLTGVVSITMGNYHALALKSDGTVWSWGYNSFVQLGDGTGTDRNFAQPVCADYDAGTQLCNQNLVVNTTGAMLAATETTSAVLSGDGTVWTWGSTGFGQRGDGLLAFNINPTQVCKEGGVASCSNPLTNVTALAGGSSHFLARDGNGNAWTWGKNLDGQLGDGTQDSRSFAVPVCQVYDVGSSTCTTPLTGVGAIGGGTDHSIARKTNGELWVWGSNFYGQLGDGSGWLETPQTVQGLP